MQLSEAQSIVDTLLADSEWMQHHGVAYLDKVVAALTMVARAAGHRAGDQAEYMLVKAEEYYDNLSLSVMDLVTDALKHDDYVARLKSIFEPLETVELLDEEGEAGDDGAE
ncbi:hypothetical protein Hanom_Chr05g00417211 [Helianthus anomalus]